MSAAPDEMLMMSPPFSFMYGRAALASRIGPRRSSCQIRSMWRACDDSSVPGTSTAALLTRMSSPPSSDAVCSTARSIESGSRTSSTTGTAVPPAELISSETVRIVPGRRGSGDASSERAATATAAPCAASPRAMSAPIPRLEPVTNALRPSSRPISTLFSVLGTASRSQRAQTSTGRRGVCRPACLPPPFAQITIHHGAARTFGAIQSSESPPCSNSPARALPWY